VPDLAPPTPAEELHTLFGDELLRLEGAVTRLARRPPDRLRPGEETVPLGRLREPARLRAVRPEHDEALLAASASSYDSYEARLLRRLLDNLWRRLELLTAALPSPLAASAATARERLRVMRAAPFLTGVPPLAAYTGPSARMQRDPDYRAVYRLWRLLRRRPLLSWDAATLSIPVGDLPRLYERWCAAAVALALLELPGRTVRAQSIVTAEGDDQLLALSDEAPLVELEGPGGALLRLRYQPRYRPLTSAFATARPSSFILHPSSLTLGSLDRHTRVPDLVIEVERQDATPALLILDAKYRLDATGGVPEAALADAYSYLGAIGSPAGERAALAVALLYPGHGPAETYASGVAALPLLPGADGALRAWLMAYLD
jgi:large subunit ribosomal protein MRP49